MTTISSKVSNHLKKIVDIGSRPIGSEANQKTAAYIKQIFLNSGLTVITQEFHCPDWRSSDAELTIDGISSKVEANTFSPSCDITGTCALARTIQELESSDFTGKIALLYGDLTKKRLVPKKCKVYSPERDQKIIQLLEDKNPTAIITVYPERHILFPILEDWDFHIPSATVSPHVGLQLMRSKQPVALKIVSQRKNSYSSNIIGTNQSENERIVLCAHYDTKIGTPGIFDNGSGVAVLLTLAEVLAVSKFPIEFVAFSDEEYNGMGDFEYVQHRNEFESIRVVINIDGVGQKLGATSIMIVEASEEFKKIVSSVVEDYPGVAWVDPWPESNHTTFSSRNVPSIALCSVGVKDIVHSPEDTMDWISTENLTEAVLIITDILDAIENNPCSWFRKDETTP
jgi:aminopeptidase YwaD